MKRALIKTLYGSLRSFLTAGRSPSREMTASLSLESFRDEEFLAMAYRMILGRAADPGGLQFYLENISTGAMSRDDVVLSLVHSEEFEISHNVPGLHDFFLDAVTAGRAEIFTPFVSASTFQGFQLNQVADPFKWIDAEWRRCGRDLGVVALTLPGMHRKSFEWVQALFGLGLLGKISSENEVLGVGTGHEPIVYWMANHFKQVSATDLFEGDWVKDGALEGDPSVIDCPEKYQPFPYQRERLKFLRMDGRNLAFPDNSFDVVFSLSSIEHFGGKNAAATAMEEMGRVLRPGGVAVIATEYILNGAKHPEFFDDGELLEYVVKPSNMKLVQDIDFRIPRIFLERPLRFPSEFSKTPHLSLTDGNVIWTSIVLFFVKEAQ
jgi:SAM-dependent methyltransferase